jgi:hypothetical protein
MTSSKPAISYTALSQKIKQKLVVTRVLAEKGEGRAVASAYFQRKLFYVKQNSSKALKAYTRTSGNQKQYAQSCGLSSIENSNHYNYKFPSDFSVPLIFFQL